ncbi:MAG TPA: 1-deoxy-D-xylulose-5-phosphate synthase [Treponemataceae bacterium]|jgi:1-deoxy-D-xylulose-5-phosphate synthase|nr:1-deoxy-D-xylulose-5-phosphate synthase [Treponemataceae bacterium]
MTNSLLASIQSPEDVRKLDKSDIPRLAREIRKTIIDVVGTNGGHLSSNLGVVELTIALHRVFSSPQDAFIWDVGHQCYTHKLLTGRYDHFSTIRKRDGLSGFPKHVESPHDIFDTGHSSTSISAALGLRLSRQITGDPGKVIAIIGDGALTGGMALEALSHAGETGRDLVVVLNDNKMSISRNTGALSEYLSRLTMGASYQRFRSKVDRIISAIPLFGAPLTRMVHRLKRGVKGMLFKDNLFVDLGFEYVGPLNGHSVEELEKVFRDVRALNRPVVVHVQTCKGKGYSLAEDDPSTFHGIGPFCISDGKVEKFDTTSFTEAFSRALLECAEKNPRVAAVTAAMSRGTGLVPFQHRYPDRFFDVGIAEQHAVTLAGGLAVGGLRPVVAIYSTFMQRAVDQLIHDVALQNLPVVFALDRSGAVPDDGETHQGIFDIALFRPVPGLSILTPASAAEMRLMLVWALEQGSPVLIRYPKAPCPTEQEAFSLPVVSGRGVFVQREALDTLIVCTGGMYSEVHEAANLLGRSGKPVDILNLRFVKPLDEAWFLDAVHGYRNVVFVEDGVITGSISRDLAALLHTRSTVVYTDVLAFQEIFYPQGNRSEILTAAGLSPAHIADCVAALRERSLSDSFL